MQQTWASRRVLVVEDNVIVAMPLIVHLEDCGALVVGPVPSLGAAFAALAGDENIDGAVLDVELGSEKVWPLAFALSERGVPFVFATGSAEAGIYPSPLQLAPRFVKPYAEDAVADALQVLIEGGRRQKGSLIPMAL